MNDLKKHGFKYPELIIPYQKQSKRDKLYPYFVSFLVVMVIILGSIVKIK